MTNITLCSFSDLQSEKPNSAKQEEKVVGVQRPGGGSKAKRLIKGYKGGVRSGDVHSGDYS